MLAGGSTYGIAEFWLERDAQLVYLHPAIVPPWRPSHPAYADAEYVPQNCPHKRQAADLKPLVTAAFTHARGAAEIGDQWWRGRDR